MIVCVEYAGRAREGIIHVPERAISSLDRLPQYVYVRAVADHSDLTFDKIKRVELSLKTLSVFVQTDKPIYVPDDDGIISYGNQTVCHYKYAIFNSVHIRIIVVNSFLVPNDTSNVRMFTLDTNIPSVPHLSLCRLSSISRWESRSFLVAIVINICYRIQTIT